MKPLNENLGVTMSRQMWWADIISRDVIKQRTSERAPAHIGRCSGYGCFHPGVYNWAEYLRRIGEIKR